jgi:2-keto-4-pentenoate hydratase
VKVLSMIAVLLCAFTAQAQTPEEYLSELIRCFDGKQPLLLSFHHDMAAGQSVQARFLAHLQTQYGPAVGYKVALTNPGAQQKFGLDRPVYGVLLKEMLKPSGATLPVGFGNLPLLEGDLIVRVGNESINTAKTHKELLAGLDAVIPFIELPDLIFKAGTTLTGPGLVAVNAGSRLGVTGEAIALAADDATLEALSHIRIEILDGEGKIVGQGFSDLLLGHPIKVVAWLRDTLAVQGVSLKKGDLISLGSMSAWVPIKAPGSFTANYYGLPTVEKATVVVHFAN